MAKPLPPLDVPVLTANGVMNQAWFEYFQGLQSTVGGILSDTPPSFTVPTITVGNTTTSITNRTVSDAGNGGLTGTDTGILGVGTSPNPQQNGWTTLMNVTNSYSTNHTNHKNASDALNTRMRAVENKLNAIIADLAARFQ